jgi:hypothetical protein
MRWKCHESRPICGESGRETRSFPPGEPVGLWRGDEAGSATCGNGIGCGLWDCGARRHSFTGDFLRRFLGWFQGRGRGGNGLAHRSGWGGGEGFDGGHGWGDGAAVVGVALPGGDEVFGAPVGAEGGEHVLDDGRD